jgi:signal transduction histidine kinase/integral membrane sensor domain MASE1
VETGSGDPSWNAANLNSRSQKAMMACLVLTLCYLAAKLGGVLIINAPQTLWPLWPGCAILVAVLLVLPRKIWPILIPAGLAGFVLYDLQVGVSIRSIAWLILADVLEILAAAWGVSYSLDGLPRLNSLKALAKYSFFAVIIAALIVSSIGIYGLNGDRWISWRISFVSEGLAFLTVTPAVLGWVGQARRGVRASRAYYLEGAVLVVGLISLGSVMFVGRGSNYPSALLYPLVPFLLWSALRFGTAGVGTSATIVALLSIWGALHGRGPFTETDPINRVLSLQLFLLFTAAPFMVLAALVEERKQKEGELREAEERLRLAVHAGRVYAFEWDTTTDVIVRSGECGVILNWVDDPTCDTGRQFVARVLPDDRELYAATEIGLTPENPTYQTSYRMLHPSGRVIWLEESGHAFFDGQGRMLRTIGMVADVTERKLAEEALSSLSRKLIDAQEQERSRIGRELHDDIVQRLALLALQLQQHREDTLILPEFRSRIGEFQKQISEIVTDIQSLSHELHSAKLQYLGIAAAMRGFCEEFAAKQKVEIDFKAYDLLSPLPPDISLCLFRVAQEALHNSAKHSGVRQFEVRLWGSSDEIQLTVRDSGAGFDLETAKNSRGLGLISMEERLKLVKGTLSINSQPKRGTSIDARVPLSSGGDSMRPVG